MKVYPVHNEAPHHENMGNGAIAQCILNLGTRWRWLDSLIPQLLYPWSKNPWYPLERKLCTHTDLYIVYD